MANRCGIKSVMSLWSLAGVLLLFSIGLGVGPAFGNIGNDRVALLIGNADYSGKDKLENPVNDVNDYGKALRQAGFTVEIKTNLGRSELFDAIEGFSKRVKNINGIALLHYAGHGFRADDTNFMVPIGVKTDGGKEKLANESVPAEAMVKLLGDSPTRVNVVILDMCRNLPSRGIRGNDGGLAPMKPVTGTLMAFSTQSGKTAQDGAGQRNSPYARNLIAALSQQDLTVTDYFAEVRALVRKETNNEQEPREDSALVGRAPTLIASGPAPAALGSSDTHAEQESWNLIKNSEDAADLRDFLDKFPSGSNSKTAKIKLRQLEKKVMGTTPEWQARSKLEQQSVEENLVVEPVVRAKSHNNKPLHAGVDPNGSQDTREVSIPQLPDGTLLNVFVWNDCNNTRQRVLGPQHTFKLNNVCDTFNFTWKDMQGASHWQLVTSETKAGGDLRVIFHGDGYKYGFDITHDN